MWAGDFVLARSIARQMMEAETISADSFQDALRPYSPKELSEVAIVAGRRAENRILLLGHNEKAEGIGGLKVFYSGSGEFDLFREDYELLQEEGVIPGNSLAPPWVLRRFGQLIHRELTDETQGYSRYGGIYELLTFSPSAGFRKVPYSIDFYLQDGQGVPHCFMNIRCRYEGPQQQVLVIHRPKDARNDPDGIELSLFLIDDVLERLPSRPAFDISKFEPEISLVYVRRVEGGFSWAAVGGPILNMEIRGDRLRFIRTKKYRRPQA